MDLLGPIDTRYGKALVHLLEYQHGKRMAVQLMDAYDYGLIATLSVNLPDESIEKGEFFVKGWNENEQIIEDCRKSGLFTDTGKRVKTGFVMAEVWRMKNAKETS